MPINLIIHRTRTSPLYGRGIHYLPSDPVPRLCDRRRGRCRVLQGLQPDRSDRKRRELQVRATGGGGRRPEGATRSILQLNDEFDDP